MLAEMCLHIECRPPLLSTTRTRQHIPLHVWFAMHMRALLWSSQIAETSGEKNESIAFPLNLTERWPAMQMFAGSASEEARTTSDHVRYGPESTESSANKNVRVPAKQKIKL